MSICPIYVQTHRRQYLLYFPIVIGSCAAIWHSNQYILQTSKLLIKQGVAVTGRNTTGPPRAAPGELHCICTVLQTDNDDRRRRQTPTTITSLLPPTLCVGAGRASNK